MGCISSKEITRSMSIREELRHGLKSRSLVWEDLLSSHTTNDQLFAFVCSSNLNTTTKPKTSSDHDPDPDPDPQKTNTSNNYLDHLITDINAKADAETGSHVPVEQPDSCKFTRSRSCHTLRENEMNLEDKNVGGSRSLSLSFHTVEEYDALLDRIRGTTSLEESFQDWDDEDDNDVKLQESTSLAEDENKAICRDSSEDSASVETGWKRKAIGRGLKSLDISSAVEFPAISRLKQKMLVQGQIYSPGTYVTPKFGTYNDPATATQQSESNEEDTAVFSSELLAAFEDCMQQLQLEEDTILRHMNNSSLQMENEVSNPSNM